MSEPFAINNNFKEVLEKEGFIILKGIPFGPSGIKFKFKNHHDIPGSIIVTQADTMHDGIDYLHASIAYDDQNIMPTYEDLAVLHHAVFGRKRWSYQVFAPQTKHISIRDNALHLWGRADGQSMLPNFGWKGSI